MSRNPISDSDIIPTFMLNLNTYISFLPDVTYTIKKYSPEIEELLKDIKKCKEENRKIVALGFGRTGKAGDRLCRGLRALGVRAYKYPEEATKMPNLGGIEGVGSTNGDLILAPSGSGTTEQTLNDLDTALYYNRIKKKKPIVYGFTHDLSSELATRVKRSDGTLVYIKGQKTDAVTDFYKRQMETPPPIAPMGSRFEFNALRGFDALTLLTRLYFEKGVLSLEPFEKRFCHTSACFASLEESLKQEKQQKQLVNIIKDLSTANRFITIAASYSSEVADMICDRARNVYPEEVDVINFDSRKEPIDTHVIPGTKILAVTKTGHSEFTRRHVNRAVKLGASYSLLTENPRVKLAKCDRRVILPDSTDCIVSIGDDYQLRMEELELVTGDCIVITVNAVLGYTEEQMIARHPHGYKLTDKMVINNRKTI